MLFVYQGNVEDGENFIGTLWRGARAVSDMGKFFYDAFGIRRASLNETFGADVWACGIRSAMKGNFINLPKGDPWTMPGVFLVDADGAILWTYEARHVGDHPDWAALRKSDE